MYIWLALPHHYYKIAVTVTESGRTMTEESLREFLSGNQTKFETAKGSKNEKSIDLMEDKYDC